MISCVIICHHQDPGLIELATRALSPHRVLVIDRSPEVSAGAFEHVVRNSEGEGFLAGRMRNLGTSEVLKLWPNLDGIIYFDCDRVPNKIPTTWAADCVLYLGQDDTREGIAGDVTAQCASLNSPFYSGGFYLSRKALSAVDGKPFAPDFDGMWGWEDADLGDRLVSSGVRIVIDKQIKVAGIFVEPEWIHTAKPSDSRFRNWHIHLKRRNQRMEHVAMQEGAFKNLCAYLYSRPYGEVHHIIAEINGDCKRVKIADTVEKDSASEDNTVK